MTSGAPCSRRSPGRRTYRVRAEVAPRSPSALTLALLLAVLIMSWTIYVSARIALPCTAGQNAHNGCCAGQGAPEHWSRARAERVAEGHATSAICWWQQGDAVRCSLLVHAAHGQLLTSDSMVQRHLLEPPYMRSVQQQGLHEAAAAQAGQAAHERDPEVEAEEQLSGLEAGDSAQQVQHPAAGFKDSDAEGLSASDVQLEDADPNPSTASEEQDLGSFERSAAELLLQPFLAEQKTDAASNAASEQGQPDSLSQQQYQPQLQHRAAEPAAEHEHVLDARSLRTIPSAVDLSQLRLEELVNYTATELQSLSAGELSNASFFQVLAVECTMLLVTVQQHFEIQTLTAG